jgi:choice-of-anchor B domain-containing protein
MKKTVTLFAFSFLLSLSLWSQGAKNISLVAHIPYPDVCADVVGYVHNGVEYAVLAHANSTAIISLANPAAPVVLQEIVCPNPGQWHEVDLYKHYAYVTNEQNDGLRIIDLSNLPGQVTWIDTVIDNAHNGHTLMIEDSTLYVYGSPNVWGAIIYSLHDPMHPVVIGQYTNTYVHDAYVRNRIAYMSEIYDGRMTMVDLTNPATPLVMGTVTTPGQFTHNTWLNDAGTVCFTTDEVDAAYVTAYDITNPSNMVELDRYRGSQSGGQSIPHNIKVLNDFGVVSYYKDGVNIVDVHRPGNMVEVGYYDTNPLSGAGFDGNWGLDCYLPSGLILAADMSTGFWVLQPTYVRASYLEGQVTDVSNGNPITNATVHIATPNLVEHSNNSGNYAMGVADPGNVTVTYSKYGYRDTTITVALTSGNVVVENIALTPNPRVAITVTVKDASNGNPIPNAGINFQEVTSGIEQGYTANANGQIVDNNFMSSNYHLIAGHWGYVTGSVDTNITALNNNIEIFLNSGYYDDFTFDFGWALSGTATDGAWERGEPQGVPFYTIFTNPDEDVTTDFAGSCIVTGNATTTDPYDDDVDGGVTILTSPVMDLSGYTNPWLIFDSWFLTTDQNGVHGFHDSLAIYIDNGTQMKRVWFVKDDLFPVWRTDTVQIASFLPFTSTTRIVVRSNDNGFDQIVEAALDKVRIEDQAFVAVDRPTYNGHLEAFPNPSTGNTRLRYNLEGQTSGTIQVVNIDGKIVYQFDLQESQGTITLGSDLPAGMYFATLETNGQRITTAKIIRY